MDSTLSAVVLYDNDYEFEMAKRSDWQHDHVHLCKFKSGILGAILGLPEWYSSREWQWVMLRNLTPFVKWKPEMSPSLNVSIDNSAPILNTMAASAGYRQTAVSDEVRLGDGADFVDISLTHDNHRSHHGSLDAGDHYSVRVCSSNVTEEPAPEEAEARRDPDFSRSGETPHRVQTIAA